MTRKKPLPDNVQTFPQHAVKPSRRAIAELLEQGSPEQALALVSAAYPDATKDEVITMIQGEIDRLRDVITDGNAELAAAKAMIDLVRPVMTGDMTIGTALKVLADQGDERAAKYLAHLQSPEIRRFYEDFKAAVKVDPYWHLDDGGTATPMEGARYKTPEELVAAYRKSRA